MNGDEVRAAETDGLGRRWRELRRHPAFQAAAVYLGGSWALIQCADIFFPSLDIVRTLGVVLAVGFLVVVGVAWWLARGAAEPSVQQAPAEAESVEAAAAPIRRRRRHLAYGSAVGLLILGGVFWWLRPSILGAVDPDAQVIAVLPFNTSGPGVELLGEGMVDLLSPNLDAVGGIRTVDSRTVLHRWRQRALGSGLDFEGSLAVGRDVDAGAVLLGSVVSAGAGVRMTAELYSVRGNALAKARAEGPADSVLALVDSLGLKLLREIWLAREPVPNLRVAGITTGNVDAIRAYLRGQQYYRRSRWDSALVALQEAVDADSTFALAHYRLGLTYGWSTEHGGFGGSFARRHGELALRYANRLPARERTLVAAHVLFEGGAVAAHDTMVAYVSRYPSDPEGLYLLGDVRYHAQSLLALDLSELLSPFDRLLELDPSFVPAMIHPLELSLMYNDSARYARYYEILQRNAEPSSLNRFQLAKLIWERPDSLLARFEEVVHDGNLGGYALLASYRGTEATPLDFYEAFTKAITSAHPDNGDQAEAIMGGALLLASVGRLEASRALFDTIWAVAPTSPYPYLSLLPVTAGIADSSFAARALEKLQNPPVPTLEQLFLYSRMVYALSRGRASEARRLAERALVADSLPNSEALRSLIQAGLGWADIVDGDTLAGLMRLESGLNKAGYAAGYATNVSQPLRYALAATQAAHPATRAEGIRRLRYGFEARDFFYLGINQLLLGQALEAAGDRAGAARAYNQFIRLWEDADPGLQPRVETARRALERLAGEAIN